MTFSLEKQVEAIAYQKPNNPYLETDAWNEETRKLIKNLQNKSVLVIQADNRVRKLWFNDKPNDDFRGYVALSILEMYSWAHIHNYAYLFQSRPEPVECIGSYGKYPGISRHWCKIITLLLALKIAKQAGIKAVLYVDTDVYPSNLNRLLGVEDLYSSFTRAKLEIPNILIATDTGAWYQSLTKYNIYGRAACTGVVFMQVNDIVENFWKRLWFESINWTTPYEILRSRLHLSIKGGPFYAGDEISFSIPEYPEYQNADFLFSYLRIQTNSVKFDMEINPSFKSTAQKMFFNLFSQRNASVWNLILNKCCQENRKPSDSCFSVFNSNRSIERRIFRYKCYYKPYSTIT